MAFVRLKEWSQTRLDKKLVLPLILFGVSVFLFYNFLIPSLREINLWDEATYINSGRLLVEGQLIPFYRNPLIGVLYALTYLPYLSSPFWMVQSAALGRFILFALLWASCYLIYQQSAPDHPTGSIVVFLFVFPALLGILDNPSDALFSATSGFALWQVFSYYHSHQAKHLWWASLFVGFTALARNDGLVLFPIFLVISLILTRKPKQSWSWIPACLVPFIALVGGYLLAYGLATGDFRLGTTERSFVAFQQGHSIVYHRTDGCRLSMLDCAVLEAQEIYGTPQENDHSIFKAISRNPRAYLQRLGKIITSLPALAFEAYGKRTAFLLFFLIARGLVELIHKRKVPVLLLLLSWTLYLGTYFLTFFRKGYLWMPFPIFYTLGAIGLYGVVADMADKKARGIWTTLLAVLSIFGVVTDTRALYFTTFLFLGGLWLGYFIFQGKGGQKNAITAPMLVFLAIGLVIRGGTFDPPIPHPIGEIPEEEAVVVLQEDFPPGTKVAAGAPGVVWAARMEFVSVREEDFLLESSQALHDKFVEMGVEAIYVDHYLSNINENIWRLIEPQIDAGGYETLYIGRQGSIRVLLVMDD
jgi:MFS family permease